MMRSSTNSAAMRVRSLAIGLVAAFFAVPLPAQDITDRDRNDRLEGAIVEQNISGGQVELIGLRREMAVPVATASGAVSLAFWLDAPRELEISVRHGSGGE